MNELQLLNNEVTMTSLDVAEMTGKRHDNVMSDIRNEIEQLEKTGINSLLIFKESNYTNERGREYQRYTFGMEGALQLGARYSAETRFKMIQHIKKLEQEKQKPQLPQDYKQALQHLLLEVEKNEQLQLEVKELKPLADYTQRILQNKSLVTITQIAKDYGLSGRVLNKILNELGIQYKQSEQWLLYKKYQDSGYVHSTTMDIVHKDGTEEVKMQTKWTQKGRLFLYKMLKENGYFPIIEMHAV
jgi:Rha family phage regulatory protein